MLPLLSLPDGCLSALVISGSEELILAEDMLIMIDGCVGDEARERVSRFEKLWILQPYYQLSISNLHSCQWSPWLVSQAGQNAHTKPVSIPWAFSSSLMIRSGVKHPCQLWGR